MNTKTDKDANMVSVKEEDSNKRISPADTDNGDKSEKRTQKAPKQGVNPSEKVREAFASALQSLKEDMGEDADDGELKAKIRKILEEEMTEKRQARNVFTAATALTSLGGDASSDGSSPPSDAEENDMTEESNAEKEKVTSADDVNGAMGGKKASVARDDVPMTFPQKLMEILEDKSNEHIITWLPHGKAFIIYQKKKFASEVLPRYFKESKYTSFTRKLNRWGYVRVTKGPEIGAYYHKCFQRGNYLLCMQMCCQSVNKSKQQQNQEHVAGLSTSLSMEQQSALMMSGQMPYPGGVISPQSALMGGRNMVGGSYPHSPQLQPSIGPVELLSQQLNLLKMTRNRQVSQGQQVSQVGSQVQQHPGGNNFQNTQDAYSSAVINAALDALQRSYQQGNSPDCNMINAKPAAKPPPSTAAVLQRQIEQYNRAGVMDPSLMQAIVNQQAAVAAMARAQQEAHQQLAPRTQQKKANRNTRAHAA